MTDARRQIVTYPDPMLRHACRPVADEDDDAFEIVDHLVRALAAVGRLGVGLSAPQIGIDRRVFVVGRHYFVNPEVVVPSADEVYDEEGCLSIPGLFAPVKRPVWVEARWMTAGGARLHRRIDNRFRARAFLHELDHLDGVLFTDRVTGYHEERVHTHLARLEERA